MASCGRCGVSRRSAEERERTSRKGIAFRTSVSLTQGNSSTPLSIRKHLKPLTPAFASGTRSFCGASEVSSASSPVFLVAAHLVPGNHAAPETHIHPALSLRSLDLLPQVRDGRRGRDRVQGHVDDRRDASRGGGLQAYWSARANTYFEQLTAVPVANPSHSVRPGSFRWT